MPEIEIKVKIGDQEESIYRFTEFPIEIGRASDCRLSICHEAVARKLCRVWVAQNGDIHLEAHPNLTNPLFENGKPVSDSISKSELMLTAGPVMLHIQNLSNPVVSRKKSLPWPSIIGTAGLAVIGLCLLVQTNSRISLGNHYRIEDFPKTVHLRRPDTHSRSDLPSDVLVQLAMSAYTRQSQNVRQQKHAIELMWRVEKQSTAGSASRRQAHDLRTAWQADLNKAYRLEIISLFNALNDDDVTRIHSAASRLQLYLNDSEHSLIKWLQQLQRYGDDQ